MSFKIILYITITIISFQVVAYETDLILEGDTLELIATRNIHRVSPRYSDPSEYKEKLKEWNPRITEWDPPSPYQYLFIDYPYDLPKYFINNKVYTQKLNLLFSDDIGDKTYSTFLTLTNSFGSYTESIGDESIKSTQNFPITVGLSFSRKPENLNHVLLGSFYWAMASNGKIKTYQGSEENIKIPGEFGANFYYQKFIANFWGIYAGLDFERLNIYNTKNVIEGSDVETARSDLVYLTGGISKNFVYFKFPMGIKASFSKSIWENSKVNQLNGSKYILFYSIRPWGKLNFNVFYKHHSFQGNTNLSIDRIGLGLSFQL